MRASSWFCYKRFITIHGHVNVKLTNAMSLSPQELSEMKITASNNSLEIFCLLH